MVLDRQHWIRRGSRNPLATQVACEEGFESSHTPLQAYPLARRAGESLPRVGRYPGPTQDVFELVPEAEYADDPEDYDVTSVLEDIVALLQGIR